MACPQRVLFPFLKHISLQALTWALMLCALQVEAQQVPDACDLLPKVTVPKQDWPTLAEAYSADVPLPKEARTEPLPPGFPPRASACDPIGLYYSHSPGHFEKARYCVLADLGLIRDTVDPAKIRSAQYAASGGATDPENIDEMSGLVLAMLYGNGEGVARNLPLTRQLICQYSGGVASNEPAQYLKDFDQLVRTGGHLNVCADHGGYFGRRANYVCLGLEEESRAAEIHRLEAAVAAEGDSQVQASFAALRSAWQALHKAYWNMDTDLCDGGTGCGPSAEGDDLTMTVFWRDALKNIQEGKAPASDTNVSTFAQLDRNLNIKYKQTLDEAQFCHPEHCTTEVRNADRAWLKYREAWVRYGTLRWPVLPADQWRAWQTAEWTSVLSGN
jgi:hypothetical protein